MKQSLRLIGSAFFAGLTVFLPAQELNSSSVERTAKQLSAELSAQKKAAWRRADELGIPKIGTGREFRYELMRFSNGKPVYYTTLNRDSVVSAGAAALHGKPFFTKGNSITVGVWDAGSALETHVELSGRVKFGDDSEETDEHATHVAGTIAAAGIDSAAVGMCPEAKIRSFDWSLDSAEMVANGARYPGDEGKVPLSNHSYGLVNGWNWNDWSEEEGWHWPFWLKWEGGEKDESFGRYDSEARRWDKIAWDAPYYLIFNAAGNDRSDNPEAGDDVYYSKDYGRTWIKRPYDPSTDPSGDGAGKEGYDSIAHYAVAKNILTVGAVSDAVGTDGKRDLSNVESTVFSGFGPTDDGRIKPDLVANGDHLYSCSDESDSAYTTMSGTSMASPSACGAAALLVNLYDKYFPESAMRASTLKGLLIHTADDLGIPGPDYKTGWGLINVEKAAQHLKDFRADPSKRILLEDSFEKTENSQQIGQIKTFFFRKIGSASFKATVCWTDPPADATTEVDDKWAKLVHNLDMMITRGENTFYYPFSPDPENPDSPAEKRANVRDNVEQIIIDDIPDSNIFKVEIFTFSTIQERQFFSLLVSGAEIYDESQTLSLRSVSPKSGGGECILELAGEYFLPGAQVSLRKDDFIIEGFGEEVTPDYLRVRFHLTDAPLGNYDVYLSNSDGVVAALPGGFQVTKPPVTLLSADLTKGIPFNWEVVDGFNDGFTWALPELEEEGKEAGVTPGLVADSEESDWAQMDEWLLTSWINSFGYTSLQVEFEHDFVAWTSDDEIEKGEVSYRFEGGPWQKTYLIEGDEEGTVIVDIPDQVVLTGDSVYLSFSSNLQIRWRYWNANNDYWWEIKNIRITGTPIASIPEAVEDRYSVQEDQVLTVSPVSGILINDVDTKSTGLSAELTATTQHGILNFRNDGSFTYTPEENFEGEDGFTYRVTEFSGNASSGEQTVTITVSPQDDVPTDITFSEEDISQLAEVGDVIGSFSVEPADPSDMHTWQLVNGTGSDHNTFVSIVGNELKLKTPLNLLGSVFKFRVQVTDSADHAFTKAMTLTYEPDRLTLYESDFDNGLPEGWSVADGLNDGFTWEAGEPEYWNDEWIYGPAIIVDSLEAEFTDLDEQLITRRFDARGFDRLQLTFNHWLLVYNSVSANLDISIGGGAWQTIETYTGEENLGEEIIDLPTSANNRRFKLRWHYFNANYDYFWILYDFKVCGRPTITAPTAADDNYDATEDTTLSVPAPGVLNNDTLPAGTWEAHLVDGPENGAASLNKNGSFTYTPNANVSGEDSFTYRILNATGGSGYATVTVSVQDTTDAPSSVTLSADSVEERLDIGSLVGRLKTDDNDSGDLHTFSLVSGAGSTDNHFFAIDGYSLKTATILDYSTKKTASIRIRAEDKNASSCESVITLTIAPQIKPLLAEDFTGGKPFTWSSDYSSYQHQWVTEDLYSYLHDGFSGEYMAVTSEGSEYTIHAELYSPAITIADFTELELTFDHIFWFYPDNEAEKAEVCWRADNGSWNILKTWSGEDVEDSASFDLPASLNNSTTVQFRWRYYNARDEWLWMIDNVHLTGRPDNGALIPEDDELFLEFPSYSTPLKNIVLNDNIGDADYEIIIQDHPAKGDVIFYATSFRYSSTIDISGIDSFTYRLKNLETGAIGPAATVLLTLENVNAWPSNISLNSTNIDDGSFAGEIITEILVTDPDPYDSHNLFLSGNEADNRFFRIEGNKLVANASFIRSQRSSYTIQITAEDSGGLTCSNSFYLNVAEKVLFSEDFESDGLPEDWKLFHGGSGATWEHNYIQEGVFAGFSGGAMTVYVDAYTADKMEETIQTPSFDCTGYTNIRLKFSEYFYYGSKEKARVYMWVNDQAKYELSSISEVDKEGWRTISMARAAEVKSVRLEWQYYKNYGDKAAFDYCWYIDSVTVTGTATDDSITSEPLINTVDIDSETVEATLSCPTNGARIYYTVDGSTPNMESGSVSSGQEIQVKRPCTIKAFAKHDNLKQSGVVEEAFDTPIYAEFEQETLFATESESADLIVRLSENVNTSTSIYFDIEYLNNTSPAEYNMSDHFTFYSGNICAHEQIHVGDDSISETGEGIRITLKENSSIKVGKRSTLTIYFVDAPVSQTLTFPAIRNMFYGETGGLLEASVSSGLPVIYGSSNTDVIEIVDGLMIAKGAGTATVTACQPGSIQYEAAIPVARTVTVSKRDLNLTVKPETRSYGEPNPAFELSGNFQSGDSADDLDASPTITCSADSSSLPGNYPVSLSGGSDDNYDLILSSGTLTVVKADQQLVFLEIDPVTVDEGSIKLLLGSTSGIQPVIELADTDIAELDNDTILFFDTGTVDVSAWLPGDERYNPSNIVSRPLQICAQGEVTNLNVKPGWNLLSLPVDPTGDTSTEILFVDSDQQPFYLGSVWKWDAINKCYQPVEDLSSGYGFWVYATEEHTVAIAGALPQATDEILEPGWNLCGVKGPSTQCQVKRASGESFSNSTMWIWDNNTYQNPFENIILRGEGFWLFVNEQTRAKTILDE